MPDTPWETLRSEILQTAESMQLEVSAYRPLPPLSTSRESEFLQAALKLLGQSEPKSVSYATDGCCFRALRHLLVIGPGSIEQAHRPNEWISLAQLERGTTIYKQMFQRFACEA